MYLNTSILVYSVFVVLVFRRCAKFVYVSLNHVRISELSPGKKRKLKQVFPPTLSQKRWKSGR